MGGAMLFMLVWQYARRGTWPTRAALAVAILTVPAMILLAHVPMLRCGLSTGYVAWSPCFDPA